VRAALAVMVTSSVIFGGPLAEGRTQKPALHGRHWMAVTGKPLAATAGAKIFEQGGNAVDAACAMIAATSTMWDTLSWGGETQALIYNPHTGKVIAIAEMSDGSFWSETVSVVVTLSACLEDGLI